MATIQQLEQAEAEFERANEALNDARTAVIRAERQFNLAREAGPDVDPDRLAQVTRNLDTARSNFQAADAAYTAAQQNFQAVFDAVDDTAAPQADPVVRQADAEIQAQQNVPLNQVQFQPDPAEVDGAGLAVTDEDLAAQDNPIITQIAQPVSEDPQAGGFIFDENGELIPVDSAQAEIIREEETRVQNARALAPLNYSVTFEDGFDWVIVDENGNFVETGFATQEEAANSLTDLQSSALSEQPPPSEREAADTENPDTQAAATTQAAVTQARAQQTIEAQRSQANQGDWRVKLRLAGGANYLYREPAISQDGILYPLALTDGVIFPYTPTITTAYSANYNSYDLTHSNYRGYFYQNSFVDEINIQAVFTAQDTAEANYMLAVIHFFRSVTKMFYGQDTNRGLPPPLVFLQGLGEFQFNLHPCVVRSFNYNLPSDVDYIRARTVTVNGTNLLQRRGRAFLPTNTNVFSAARLTNSNLSPGAETALPAPPTLGTNKPTYVPTRLEMTVMLLPVQTREQVSKQFSVKQYANGDLIKGGFW